jgi:mRNA-degrading endonuclease toxin of MazEF toxin-antitoxin module
MPSRGDIYLADMTPGVGTELSGIRPVLVIKYFPDADLVLVAPMEKTSLCDKEQMGHYSIDPQTFMYGGEGYTVLTEQLRSIAIRRLRDFLTHLSEEGFDAVYVRNTIIDYLNES